MDSIELHPMGNSPIPCDATALTELQCERIMHPANH